ncbi:hypothetical protein CYMTET_47847 [Cymbomonas tetramitiformis]|uniref:Uncharacterized protein n=1 Tax=Cymbomonas tetramitiformis TaxID=36881 RepID=A0AAE0EWB2_9CHLO|nr:hypothetical protein CYMTET_47847 [Cymbomonas tetramitiformis]
MRGGAIICAAEDCPPEDKPWLLSSRRMLAEHKVNGATRKKKWSSAEGKFPGANASLEDKLEWMHWVQYGELESDFELLFDRTRPNDPKETVQQILYDTCTPTVNVQLCVSREAIDRLSSVIDENTFINSSLRRQGDGCPAECSDGASFLQWLKTAPVGGNFHATPIPTAPQAQAAKLPEYYPKANTATYVVFATTQLLRDASTSVEVAAVVKQLGLPSNCVVRPVGSRREFAHSMAANMAPKIGEIVHFPEHGGDSAVALEIFIPSKVEKDQPFEEELKVKEEASEGKQGFMLIEKGLSKPKPKQKRSKSQLETGDDCDDDELGEGECEDIKKRLDKGNTDPGHLRFDMVNQQLHTIKYEFKDGEKDERTALKFCRLLGLIQAIFAGLHPMHWMFDNECPTEVVELVKDIAAYCRTFLGVKNSNQTLGLGHPTEDADGISSREALYVLLRYWGQQLQIKANFIPGHSRQKRKAPEGDN